MTAAYTVPTKGEEADGTLSWSSTTLVVVQATAGGELGLGFTYAPAAAAKVVRDELAPVVVGSDATAPTAAWQAMVDSVRNAGRPGLVSMAVSAVDIALWDLTGRLHDLPLTTLWGHALGGRVPVYGSGGFTNYDQPRTEAQLAAWLDLELPRVKIKIGEDHGSNTERDLERATVVRELAGAGVEVYVDANGAYNVAQACRVGSALDEIGVTWFEEPVSSEDRAGLARVRDHVAADVAAGEYGWGLDYYPRLLSALDCVQIDATRCGGYTEWFRIAALAAAHHLDVSGHCAPYLSLPVASATTGFRHQEWFSDHVRIEQKFFENTPDPVGGTLVPPDAPGHGLSFRTADATGFRVA